MSKPCIECPYLKKSLRGYLGVDSHNPIWFLRQLELPEFHPCHMTVDYEKDDYSKATPCVGGLQFMNNSGKLSRYQVIREYQEELGKNDEVLAFPHNFIRHHS